MTSTQMRADRDALSVADVLDRAADLITPEGAWIQGQYESRGCFCALGAISQVATGSIHADWQRTSMKLARTAGEYVFGHLDEVVAYNDAEGRTQSEVVEALREAAALAREQGL